jgi:hypothetical protein
VSKTYKFEFTLHEKLFRRKSKGLDASSIKKKKELREATKDVMDINDELSRNTEDSILQY